MSGIFVLPTTQKILYSKLIFTTVGLQFCPLLFHTERPDNSRESVLDRNQTMTEAAIFTIGRSRIIGYGKIWPLADYRSRLLNFKRYIQLFYLQGYLTQSKAFIISHLLEWLKVRQIKSGIRVNFDQCAMEVRFGLNVVLK